MQIKLNSVDKVICFVNIMSKIDEDIDLMSGKYIVDAKSILGIFSLDLSKPIKVEFNGNEDQKNILDVISQFVVN